MNKVNSSIQRQSFSEYQEIGNLALKRIQKESLETNKIINAFEHDWPKLDDKERNNLIEDLAYYAFGFCKEVAKEFVDLNRYLTVDERISLINKMIVNMHGQFFVQRSLKGLDKYWDELLKPIWQIRLKSSTMSQEEHTVFMTGIRYLRGQRLLEAFKMAMAGPQISAWNDDLNYILIALKESYDEWRDEVKSDADKLIRKNAVLEVLIYIFKNLYSLKSNDIKNYTELNKYSFDSLVEVIRQDPLLNSNPKLFEKLDVIITKVKNLEARGI